MRLNPQTFTFRKVEEDPQGCIDEIEKFFGLYKLLLVEGMEFATYQLKDMTYQWYKEWETMRGDDAE